MSPSLLWAEGPEREEFLGLRFFTLRKWGRTPLRGQEAGGEKGAGREGRHTLEPAGGRGHRKAPLFLAAEVSRGEGCPPL